MKQIILVFAFAIFLLSCQNQQASKWETFKYIQGNTHLTNVNLGDSAHGHGDGRAWEATLTDTLGNKVGEVLGWTITVDIMDGDSANPKILTERIGLNILNFGDENAIIAQGITSYYNGEQLLKIGATRVTPIVGGTGKYKGVEGEYSITRQPDSSYVYLLNIKMED